MLAFPSYSHLNLILFSFTDILKTEHFSDTDNEDIKCTFNNDDSGPTIPVPTTVEITLSLDLENFNKWMNIMEDNSLQLQGHHGVALFLLQM